MRDLGLQSNDYVNYFYKAFYLGPAIAEGTLRFFHCPSVLPEIGFHSLTFNFTSTKCYNTQC